MLINFCRQRKKSVALFTPLTRMPFKCRSPPSIGWRILFKSWKCCQCFLILQEDAAEETGWKLVHGDVFRPPKCPKLLAALLGSGVQIFLMVLITLGMTFMIFMLVLIYGMDQCKTRIKSRD